MLDGFVVTVVRRLDASRVAEAHGPDTPFSAYLLRILFPLKKTRLVYFFRSTKSVT